jgi:hypothetical protein
MAHGFVADAEDEAQPETGSAVEPVPARESAPHASLAALLASLVGLAFHRRSAS